MQLGTQKRNFLVTVGFSDDRVYCTNIVTLLHLVYFLLLHFSISFSLILSLFFLLFSIFFPRFLFSFRAVFFSHCSFSVPFQNESVAVSRVILYALDRMPAAVGYENVIRSPWSREAADPTKFFVSCWYFEREVLLALRQTPHWITIPRPLPETAYAVHSQGSSVPEDEDTPFHCNVGPQNVKDNVLEMTRSPLLSAAHEQYLSVSLLYRTAPLVRAGDVLLCFLSRRFRSKGLLRIPLPVRSSVWPYLSLSHLLNHSPKLAWPLPKLRKRSFQQSFASKIRWPVIFSNAEMQNSRIWKQQVYSDVWEMYRLP